MTQYHQGLAIVSGPSEGKYFSLRDRTVTIGRSESCTIQIVDELVSGHHLKLRFDETEEAYYASDMQSTNGVLVNNKQISAETKLSGPPHGSPGSWETTSRVEATPSSPT